MSLNRDASFHSQAIEPDDPDLLAVLEAYDPAVRKPAPGALIDGATIAGLLGAVDRG